LVVEEIGSDRRGFLASGKLSSADEAILCQRTPRPLLIRRTVLQLRYVRLTAWAVRLSSVC